MSGPARDRYVCQPPVADLRAGAVICLLVMLLGVEGGPAEVFTTAAEAWLMAGGPHHTAYTQALDLEVVEDFAEMLDVELLTIDADTTVRGFKKELGWTAAYRTLRTGA